ncbi:MAG: ABC transporter permease [Elusimicrobia bacterium]|nr:ABC transporter permease [Elusimicrobiota bacterium]
MIKFFAKRLAMLPLVMAGVTILLFTLLQFLSPEMRAALYVKDPRQLSALEQVIQKYHLRDPMPVQYWVWLKQVLPIGAPADGKGFPLQFKTPDLGYSETAKMPVFEAIQSFFPATLELTLMAFIPIMAFGIWFGTLSAVHKDKFVDHLSRFIAITGYSLPSFVLGLLLLMIFYGKLQYFPPGRYSLDIDMLVHDAAKFNHYTGFLLLDSLLNRNLAVFWDVLKHLILPGVTLMYISVALLVRITRSSMLEELSKDYVRTARAKGLPERVVVGKHARRNALIPVVTLSSLLFVRLLGGVVITETVFDYPGIGRWGVNAAQQLDVPGVLGSALLSAMLFVVANMISDIVYAVVDPRIRVQ